MTSISCCVVLSGEQQARLRESGAGDWEVRFSSEQQACRGRRLGGPSDSPVIFGNPEPEVVAGNHALRWLQLESVGFGEYGGLDWSRPSGSVQVTNLAGFFADPVAETALAGILALGRGIDRLSVLKQQAEWVGDPLREDLRLLKGASVLLFGHGAINRRLAELLSPFGCRITPFASDWSADALDQALGRGRYRRRHRTGQAGDARPVRPITVRAHEAGRRLLQFRPRLAGRRGRRWPKRSNLGHLGGAVIDVTEDEPLPPGHPFWRCPNTIVTQHSGGGTADELDRKIDVFLDNLARYRADEPLVGVVDFAKGY